MTSICEKLVNKNVEKMVDKMWKETVEKMEMWNKTTEEDDIFSQNEFFALSFKNNFRLICTALFGNSYLLNWSFTRFPHRTINTTTLLYNK